MKAISDALKAALKAEVAQLVTCWRVELRSGDIIRLTDCDRDVTMAGEVFHGHVGVKGSSFVHAARMKVDNAEITLFLDHEGIAENALIQGEWDGARVEVFQCDANHPEWGGVHVKSGWIGQVRFTDGVAQAELRGLSQRLQQQLGEVYSPRCRAQFCDARCTLNAALWTFTGTVTEVVSQSHFADAGRGEETGFFRHGTVTFLSGRNEGITMEVKTFADGQFTLMLPLPAPLAVGDAYSAFAGCDKEWNTCLTRFANGVNFRGEPHVPGLDKMFETAATRSVW